MIVAMRLHRFGSLEEASRMRGRQTFSYVIALLMSSGAIASAQDQQPTPQPSQPEPTQPEPMQQEPSQPSSDPQPLGQEDSTRPIEVMAERMSATATVDKVDTKKRQLTLRDDDGNQFRVNVPADVTNFRDIKGGDRITLDYYSSVALALQKGAKGKATATTTEERVAGQLPGGLVARKMSATAQVVKVDADTNVLTLKTPAGRETVHVIDPEMQSELANLKKGDRIRATYTEAVAVTIDGERDQQQQNESEKQL
jgi:hypothetical protein